MITLIASLRMTDMVLINYRRPTHRPSPFGWLTTYGLPALGDLLIYPTKIRNAVAQGQELSTFEGCT